MAGESDESYAEIAESLSKVNDLLDRLRAEPSSPKRDAAIERLSSVMVSSLSVVRELGGGFGDTQLMGGAPVALGLG